MSFSKAVLLFALGSRGDVASIFTVAQRMIAELSNNQLLILITHQEHEVLLIGMKSTKVFVWFVPFPCVSLDSTSNCEFHSKGYFENLVQTLTAKNLRIILVITNLFALEGWILSSTICVRCIIVHPCKPVSLDPPNLPKAMSLLKKRRPDHFHAISSVDNSVKHLSVSWNDYVEWLWPSIVDECFDEVYSALKNSSFMSQYLEYNGHVIPAPIVLITASPYLYPPPAQWPAHYKVCGAISGEVANFTHHCQASHGPINTINDESCKNIDSVSSLSAFLVGAGAGMGVVCVDFGSMTRVVAHLYSFHCFCAALLRLTEQYRFVVVCQGHYDIIRNALVGAARAGFGRNVSSSGESVSDAIHLLRDDANHSELFKRCVAVVHHGGVGTATTCLRVGVPQVTVPIMYDQHGWADRICELHLGPKPLRRECVFPELHDPSARTEEAVEMCTEVLRVALAQASAPMQRLRCGSVGHNVRNDSHEDGENNVMAVVLSELEVAAAQTAENCTFHPAHILSAADSIDNTTTPLLQHQTTFPNGMTLFTHSTAPEETVFLFEEVCEGDAYYRHGVRVQRGDLVIDVGANIGMFAVHSELKFSEANALRIVAIEPVSHNFRLLQRNLRRYAPTSKMLNVAVGCVDANSALRESAPQRNSTTMKYFPSFPGNSCCAEHATANKVQRYTYMNPRVLAGMRMADEAEEECELVSLSTIIDNLSPVLQTTCCCDLSIHSVCVCDSSNVIHLLKVDVEGSELSVLRSVTASHWQLIQQVVVEVSLDLLQEVELLLEQYGFKVTVDAGDRLTGCIMLYATRPTAL